ncbi:hypothetical protein J9303_00835 [Bacillaceae bacterium Marseille-Q3522]|nr:hypothetical protein [Bacillaceae bacterium Marseille-Q3522]
MDKQEFVNNILTRREAEQLIGTSSQNFTKTYLKTGRLKPVKEHGNGPGKVQLFWKGDILKMQFIKELEELKGKEVTLLDLDNALQPAAESTSIFEYGKTDWENWKDGNKAAFSYKIEEDADINVWFEIITDNGISGDTVVKVLGWEQL